MDLKEVATSWIKMWGYDVNDPQREQFDWVADFEYDAVYENPDLALDLVLEILRQDPSSDIIEVLAAGPLEQVLAENGSSIIERVESTARMNPNFAHLLGGVWQNSMSDEIWKRVKNVWNRSGWDGNA